MKIGVISDSHDQRQKILEAIHIFNKEKVELVIHCGDWVSPFAAAWFRALKCPVKGVFGNNDGDREAHRKRNSFIEYHDDQMELDIDGRKIFVAHGHDTEMVENALKPGKHDAVFSGHTHIAHSKMVGKTLWLNPGTLMDETSDKVKGVSVAVYDTATNTATIVRI